MVTDIPNLRKPAVRGLVKYLKLKEFGIGDITASATDQLNDELQLYKLKTQMTDLEQIYCNEDYEAYQFLHLFPKDDLLNCESLQKDASIARSKLLQKVKVPKIAMQWQRSLRHAQSAMDSQQSQPVAQPGPPTNRSQLSTDLLIDIECSDTSDSSHKENMRANPISIKDQRVYQPTDNKQALPHTNRRQRPSQTSLSRQSNTHQHFGERPSITRSIAQQPLIKPRDSKMRPLNSPNLINAEAPIKVSTRSPPMPPTDQHGLTQVRTQSNPMNSQNTKKRSSNTAAAIGQLPSQHSPSSTQPTAAGQSSMAQINTYQKVSAPEAPFTNIQSSAYRPRSLKRVLKDNLSQQQSPLRPNLQQQMGPRMKGPGPTEVGPRMKTPGTAEPNPPQQIQSFTRKIVSSQSTVNNWNVINARNNSGTIIVRQATRKRASQFSIQAQEKRWSPTTSEY